MGTRAGKILNVTHRDWCEYIIHFLVMYLRCTGLGHWLLSPVGVVGLLLPFDSLPKILALSSTTTVQSPQVLVDLLKDWSLLLLLLPPVSLQGIAL